MTKKEFALNAILPYFIDPTTCGYDKEMDSCVYITEDGRKCVAGKYMLESVLTKWTCSIGSILRENDQSDVFKPEFVGILTNDEWRSLQLIHDEIVYGWDITSRCENSNLFTLEELENEKTKNLVG